MCTRNLQHGVCILFKLMIGIVIFASAIYFLIEKQFNFGVPALIVAVIFSKYTTGYYCLGLECLLDSESDCDSDSSSDSGGGDGGGGD